MHQVFVDNPDLYQFCKEGSILQEIETLLNNPSQESNIRIQELIQQTQFSQELSQKLAPKTLIIGNGDAWNYEVAMEMIKVTGVDGVMIGRGIFKDPWAFLPVEQKIELDTKTNRIKMLIQHTTNWQTTWGTQKHFPTLRKFVKMYINGFPNAVELRTSMMEAQTPEELIAICQYELGKD